MNGVTGRMGTNQHLLRSIKAIREQGGVKLSTDEVIMPDPILVGRNAAKLKELGERSGIEKYTTDLDSVINDPHYQIYFDSQVTGRRAAAVRPSSDYFASRPNAAAATGRPDRAGSNPAAAVDPDPGRTNLSDRGSGSVPAYSGIGCPSSRRAGRCCTRFPRRMKTGWSRKDNNA